MSCGGTGAPMVVDVVGGHAMNSRASRPPCRSPRISVSGPAGRRADPMAGPSTRQPSRRVRHRPHGPRRPGWPPARSDPGRADGPRPTSTAAPRWWKTRAAASAGKLQRPRPPHRGRLAHGARRTSPIPRRHHRSTRCGWQPGGADARGGDSCRGRTATSLGRSTPRRVRRRARRGRRAGARAARERRVDRPVVGSRPCR